LWQDVNDLLGLGGARAGAKPLPTVERRCPECLNALDPRWTKCPYCEAARNAGMPSTRIVAPEAPAPAPAPAAATVSRRPTRVDVDGADGGDAGPGAGPHAVGAPTGTGGGGRRPTRVEPLETDEPFAPDPGRAGAASRQAGGGRRLTGIVTTFTWSRLGRLYEVRDGRNFAGSGVVSADNDAPCDILVDEDDTLSNAHFLILCQNGKYIISDNFSTNGTFLNGEQIDTRGVALPHDAVIRAGATVFRFQKIAPVADTAGRDPGRPESAEWKAGEGESLP
jgi:hypothetical protein